MAAHANPIEVSFPLPKAPHAILHGHLTFLEGCAMVHLTTSELGESGSTLAPLGSFVYTMPDVSILSSVTCTKVSSRCLAAGREEHDQLRSLRHRLQH